MLRAEEAVCEMGGRVCALRLRGRDAKFRYSSLQRLIEYRQLRGNISYRHAHINTYTSHLSQRDGGGVHNMRAVSSEMGVLLLLDNEGQVVRGVAKHLMAFLGEGDPGALLPPFLHLHVEHALFRSQRVFVHLPEACNFHTLCHAHQNVLQRYEELVNFGHTRWLGPAPVSMMPAEVGKGGSQERVKQVVVGVEFEVEEHAPGMGVGF